MSQNKTQPSKVDVKTFLLSVRPEEKQQDCFTPYSLMKNSTEKKGILWGESIVGFGSYRYKYKSGREGNWFLIGFSPRKNNLTLYLSFDLEQIDFTYEKLGKHKRGKGCLYIKSLKDIEIKELEVLIKKAISLTKAD